GPCVVAVSTEVGATAVPVASCAGGQRVSAPDAEGSGGSTTNVEGAGAGAGAALQGAALVLAHAAPDSGLLTGLQRPAEAGVGHVTTPAYLLGLFDLQDRGSGVADREEQLGVHVTGGCAVAPVHAVRSSCRAVEVGSAYVNGFTCRERPGWRCQVRG